MSRHTGAGVSGGWGEGVVRSHNTTTGSLHHYYHSTGTPRSPPNPPLPLHIQIKLATAQSNFNPIEK